MQPTATARLSALRNRSTLYELALIHPDGRQYLIAYSERRSRDAIFKCVAKPGRREPILRITGADSLTFAERSADGATLGEWRIRFTGRTERDAIAEGELVYVAKT